MKAGLIGAAPAVVDRAVLQGDLPPLKALGQTLQHPASQPEGVGAQVVRGVEHQKARLFKGRQRKAPQPQDERPDLVKIRLLPGLLKLGGKDVLVIQGAGALHQGRARKGASGEVGGQSQLPSSLLGVKLPLAVDDDDPKAAAQAVWILPQQSQKLQKGAVRAEFVHMDREDQALFPSVFRKLPGVQLLRRQVLQRKLQPAL